MCVRPAVKAEKELIDKAVKAAEHRAKTAMMDLEKTRADERNMRKQVLMTEARIARLSNLPGRQAIALAKMK